MIPLKDTAPREPSTANDPVMLPTAPNYLQKLVEKKARSGVIAADQFSARKPTMKIVNYVDVCCKRMHKQ